jgi:putative ABC transport system permease protein
MFGQIVAIALTNLRSLPGRWAASAVVVVGIAGVVGVMVSVLAMAYGFQKIFSQAGRADRVIVLRAGDTSGGSSAITRAQAPTLLGMPGIKKDTDGKPLASIQKFYQATLVEKKTGTESGCEMRGIGEKGFAVWPEVHIVEGRAFKPGLRELIVGRAAQRQFQGLQIGGKVVVNEIPWEIVGAFEADGTVFESELWGDAELILTTHSMTGQFSSMVAVLENDAAFDTLKNAVTTNPTLSHTVLRESEFYAEQSGVLGGLMKTLGYAVASIMALGALFSAANTMFAAVKSRAVEIATLRAIGFRALPVLTSVLVESLALCIAGALLGGGLAWLFFNGYSVSTASFATFSQVSFAFRVSVALLIQGVIWSFTIGLLGGVWPAVRASRAPVAEALRAA